MENTLLRSQPVGKHTLFAIKYSILPAVCQWFSKNYEPHLCRSPLEKCEIAGSIVYQLQVQKQNSLGEKRMILNFSLLADLNRMTLLSKEAHTVIHVLSHRCAFFFPSLPPGMTQECLRLTL